MASVPAAPAAQRGERRHPFVVRGARLLLAYGMLGALLAVYARETPQFRPREVLSIANSGMTQSVAGLGQTLVVRTGGIDLSVGPLVSLTNSVASAIARKEDPAPSMALAVVTALGMGGLGGLLNGLLLAYGRV